MNLITGSEFILYNIDQRPLAYCKNTVLSLKANLIDITSKDSQGWNQSMMGNRDWSIDFEGLVSHDDEFDAGFFIDKMLSGEPFFVKFGVIQDHFEYSFWGEVNIESINQNADVDDIVSFEGKLKGIGDLQTTNEGSPEQNGYLKVESDPIFRGSAAFNITNQNKTNWNTTFDKTLQSIEFNTVNNTTTLFATLRDGSKYSSAFINAGGSGGSGEITALNFNTNNGNLKVNNLTTSLDGRYQTIGDYASNTFLNSNYYSKIQSDDRFYLKTNPDMYLNKVTADGLYSNSGHTHTFASLISKPTTVGGFGISDVYTKTEADGKFLQSETDTLDSVLGRGNTSGKNINLNGDAYFSKQLSIPTVVPSNLTAGKHYIYSTDSYGGTGSTGGGVGVSYYKDLADVSLSNLLNGQSPVWNSTIQKWENKNVIVDLSGYALNTGLNASGLWPISITGNASSATNWGGRGAELSNASVALFRPVVIDGTDGKAKLGIDTQFQSWLGLGSAAYLNADVTASANTIVRRDGSGHLYGNYLYGGFINMSAPGVDTVTMTDFVTTASDGFLRRNSIDNVKARLGITPETLQSVMNRGSGTANTLYITGSNRPTGNPTGKTLGLEFTGEVGNVFAYDYSTSSYKTLALGNLGKVIIGYTTEQPYKLAVDGSGYFNTSVTAGVEINAPTFHANNWFRSAGDTGWYHETYAGGIYMTDSTWVRVYGNKGFWSDNQIRGTEFISQYAGFKSNNFTGLAGDYEITGTTDKIIWTIGNNWNTIESMYGIGYQYNSKYVTAGHQIVFREAGTVRASINTSTGSAYFDGTVTATKIKATENLAIPTAAPNNPESGTHYIYSSI